MNEQQLDAPGPRREVAPSEARAIICIPTDQTGEALIAMLQEVSRASRDNDHRLMDEQADPVLCDNVELRDE